MCRKKLNYIKPKRTAASVAVRFGMDKRDFMLAFFESWMYNVVMK